MKPLPVQCTQSVYCCTVVIVLLSVALSVNGSVNHLAALEKISISTPGPVLTVLLICETHEAWQWPSLNGRVLAGYTPGVRPALGRACIENAASQSRTRYMARG